MPRLEVKQSSSLSRAPSDPDAVPIDDGESTRQFRRVLGDRTRGGPSFMTLGSQNVDDRTLDPIVAYDFKRSGRNPVDVRLYGFGSEVCRLISKPIRINADKTRLARVLRHELTQPRRRSS